MKKIWKSCISSLLIASLFCVRLPGSAQAAEFSDVSQNAWYRTAVHDLVEKQIISGTGEDRFSPAKNLTRAEFVTMLTKTALTAEDLDAYRFQGDFKDVSVKSWSNPYVNWASENGVVSGYKDNTFRPNNPVTRQEMAVMVMNFANATGRKVSSVQNEITFEDEKAIAQYAAASVKRCQTAGIISGYKDGTFRPKGSATRAEAAALYSNFLKSCVQSKAYTLFRKRMNGIPVRVVEFDPSGYSANLVLGRDLVDGSESAQSIVQRSGAAFAVNAAFFNMSSYLPVGTMIKENRVLTIADMFAPATPAFVEDPTGKYSIQNFATTYTITRHYNGEPLALTADEPAPQEPAQDASDGDISPEENTAEDDAESSTENDPDTPPDEEDPSEEEPGEEPPLPVVGDTVLKKLGFNTWPTSKTDATRILFTRDWGHSLCFKAKDAVTLDENGTVLAVEHDVDAAIPEKGYVLAQRARRWEEGDFFDTLQVGEVLEIQRNYEGASSQDVTLSVAAGPRLVKGGTVYGGLETYHEEGFRDPNITTYSAVRMCIGIKADGKLVLVSAYGTLAELSRVMVSLGCQEAINLDGGGSSALYADGFWLRSPQRSLNNMLVFTPKSK